MIAFEEEIEILVSLQKPRKITIRGSDGHRYIFLCKPKDDLRKDSRMMEFNHMINLFLKKDSEARKRALKIKTYAVIPLNEECGLIEWVNKTRGFRHILLKAYKMSGMYVSPQEVKQMMEQKNKSAHDIFVKEVLPKYPPLFYQWFLGTFPEPHRWFASKQAYASTTAAMSMVGYVVGLGDRHGENVLFDESTGGCVHVDLNCLFEKGLTFEKPEKVPFRLTHNMIDALGVTGVEGRFRQCCQETMRVLRTNRDTLMTVLETFTHDPLCEWIPRRHQVMQQPSALSRQQQNEFAAQCLATIDKKLSGTATPGLPLSVEGQVHELIQQATDPFNLSVMYIGK